MAHSVQKVVVRCEDAEENGGKLGKLFKKCYFYIGMYRQDCQCCGFSMHAVMVVCVVALQFQLNSAHMLP